MTVVDRRYRAAVALAAFCVLAAVLFHANLADRSHLLHFEKDLAIAGGLLALFAFGAGRYSVDGALAKGTVGRS